LVGQGKNDKAKETLSYLRNLPIDHELVQIEYLEIQAEALFEKRVFARAYPKLAAKENGSIWMRELAQYANCFRTKDNFKRVSMGWLVMFFQQWSGIDASKYSCTSIWLCHSDLYTNVVRFSHLLCFFGLCQLRPGI